MATYNAAGPVQTPSGVHRQSGGQGGHPFVHFHINEGPKVRFK